MSHFKFYSEVFGNRYVIATLDLPSHITNIAYLLRNTKQYSTDNLIRQHTLFFSMPHLFQRIYVIKPLS
jgi:hypothetical protein